MPKDEVLGRLLTLPADFSRRGNVSVTTLLVQSGYCERHSDILEEDIERAISANPQHIIGWIEYSENKRTESGWYIKQEGQAGFVVGNCTPGRNEDQRSHYSDKAKACAAFIKMEIESIREEMIRRG
jgi:hypothetical protein